MVDKQALLIYIKRALLILHAGIEKYRHQFSSDFIVHFKSLYSYIYIIKPSLLFILDVFWYPKDLCFQTLFITNGTFVFMYIILVKILFVT